MISQSDQAKREAWPRSRNPVLHEGRYRVQYQDLNLLLNDILPGPNNIAKWTDGEAEASVCFDEGECSWGWWKQQRAGILRFFTSRYEPQGFKLSTLTTELSFHDDSQTDSSALLSTVSTDDIYILHRPAPEIVVPKRSQNNAEQESWKYSSFLKGDGQRYTTAVWRWETGTGSHLLGDLHGGVLVGHHDGPFHVRCKVEGRLVGPVAGAWAMARRILKFVSRTADEVKSFRLSPVSGPENLESLVAELPRKMEALIHGNTAVNEYTVSCNADSSLAQTVRQSMLTQERFQTLQHKAFDNPMGLPTADDYSIAIICALPKELLAVRLTYDHSYAVPNIDGSDTNHYACGVISGHNIVAACLPSKLYGNSSATGVASQLKRSFPNVELCILVGIAGGIPSSVHDIRLGDIVVSDPGIIKYDFEKVLSDGVSQQIGMLQSGPRRLLTSISNLTSNPDLGTEPLRPYMELITARMPEYCHPGLEKDILFEAHYQHVETKGNDNCMHCNGPIILRQTRSTTYPVIHYGLIASGDKLMKNAQVRDQIGVKHNALCIEMEGAGIASALPCLSVRGICDYSDSHKHDAWQEYACASAAAYTKLLLTHTRHFGSGQVMK